MTMHQNLVARRHIFRDDSHLLGASVFWVNLYSKRYARPGSKLATLAIVCLKNQRSWLSSRGRLFNRDQPPNETAAEYQGRSRRHVQESHEFSSLFLRYR